MDSMSSLTLTKIFFNNIKKQKLAFSLLVITSFFWAIQQSITPWAVRYIVNSTYAMQGNDINIVPIGNTLIAFILVFIVSELIIRSQGVFIALVLPTFKSNMKMYFINNLLDKNYDYFLERMPGNITQKINDIAVSAERVIHIVVYNFLTIVSSLLLTAVMLLAINPLYSLFIIVWFSIHIITTTLRLQKSLHKTKEHNVIQASISGSLCELITGISLIKTYLGKKYELEKINGQLLKEKQSSTQAQLFFEKAKVIQSILSIIFILALITHQIYSFNHGTQSIGDFIFVAYVTFNLINYVWFSSFQLTIFAREYGTLRDAYESLTKGEADPYESNIQDIGSRLETPHLTIKHMNYTFPTGNRVINNFTLSIPFGKKIILQGKSGSGKSTLAKILVGLYAEYSGDVFVGEKQLNSISREELSSLIMLVEQKPLLFNRTVRENICYGNKNCSEERLAQVLQISCCSEFIKELDQGLDTRLGENGLSLSGGQIQRVALARALLFNPKILILDESTSGLDHALQRQVVTNLAAIKNQTLLIISHSIELLSIIPTVINFMPGYDRHSLNLCEGSELICQN
jgi:ATP-binding cassette subfamily B protein